MFSFEMTESCWEIFFAIFSSRKRILTRKGTCNLQFLLLV